MTAARFLRYAVVIMGALAAAWLLGLILFVAEIHTYQEPPINEFTETTDAIVVLTGGSDRVSTGLQLLAAGKASKLLISGVHPGSALENILGNEQVSPHLRECCITLGHHAGNTIGNAEETARWMEVEHFHSLRLVTAHYHMPRSLMLFRELLPDDKIIPHPVVPDSVHLDQWWSRAGTASLLVTEYDKFLLAELRTKLGELQ